MGQAKVNRQRLMNSPCRCRSTKLAADCCFNGSRWHKPAARLRLGDLPAGESRERCYMRELATCEDPISGEHLISRAVMEVLRGDGDFTISGVPWLEAGVEKAVGLNSLTANCLCRRHNAAL